MMYYRNTTQVPNFVLDKWLKLLTRSEILLLLIIIRQTIGWFNSYTGKRKEMDRITQSQFVLKTGLTARMVSKSLNSLLEKKLIAVYDKNHVELNLPSDRKGKYILQYSLKPMNSITLTKELQFLKPENCSSDNKTKQIKLKETKLSSSPFRTNSLKSVGELLKR